MGWETKKEKNKQVDKVEERVFQEHRVSRKSSGKLADPGSVLEKEIFNVLNTGCVCQC